MQYKSFITALMALVQVSHSMPHFELNFTPSAPAPTPTAPAISVSQIPVNNDPKPSGDNGSGFSSFSFPEISAESPGYPQIQQLYDYINQFFSKYGLDSQFSSNEMEDRMGNLSGALNDDSANQTPSALSAPPAPQASQPSDYQLKAQPQPQPQPQSMSQSSGDNVGATDKFDPIEFTKLVNEFRNENGAPPVELKEALSEDALDHANYMGKINDLTHDRAPGDEITTKLKQYGFLSGGAIGENICEGALTTQDVFSSWKGSPGHAENMKNPAYKYMGVAMSGKFASQEFSN